MTRHLRLPVLLAVAATVLAGCSLYRGAYQPVQYFDIRTAPPAACPQPRAVTVQISSLKMSGPYRAPMVYRKSAHRLERDAYHRWIDVPEVLLTREFHQAFTASTCFAQVLPDSAPLASGYRLSGDVLTFECDPELHAVVCIVLRLDNLGTAKPVRFDRMYSESVALKDSRPEAFADAASAAVSAIVEAAIRDVSQAIPEP